MSPEVADRNPYGAASDTYGLGCVLLEMLVRQQMRERRPFETRKDYITEALDSARAQRWDTYEEMCELAWRMLDENPKTRIALPTAAAEAAAAVSCLGKQQEVAAVANPRAVAPDAPSHHVRVRPAKRVATEERTRRASTQERRRRLQYAD